MPKYPEFSERLSGITGSIFEKFAAKMAAQGENLVKLHIGDCYMPPGYQLPFDYDAIERFNLYYQYGNTFGLEVFRDTLSQKLAEDNGLSVGRENILVTSGASNALSAAVMTLADPGEEVLLLSPFWPLFIGMVRVAGAKPVEIPFYTKLFDEPDLEIEAYLSEFVNSGTTAIYLNTPNNPSGKVLSRAQIQQVADFARSHDLWVISDEAYDGLTFDGLEHFSIASLPGMASQTVSMFTFSKSFMFPGLRLGYAVADPQVIKSLNKMMVHQIYSAPTISQYMMIEPIKSRKNWLPGIRAHYQALRNLFVESLEVAVPKPEGTYFVFFDAQPFLHGRSYEELIGACLDAGVSIAPGDSFGRDYASWIRLCFTGETPEKMQTGIARLNEVFAAA